MDTSAIDNLLSQLRTAAATGSLPARSAATAVKGADFPALLQRSLDGINGSQVEAARLARAFELGAPDASLNDVMISMQKANISFQQMVQVRNRLVSAYNDIMNMQV